MRVVVLSCVAALLAGCAAIAEDAIKAQHQRDVAACNHKLQEGKFKFRIEFQVCMGSANAKVWARTKNWDLFLSANAQDFALAERFDRGGMSEAEYRAARAKIGSDLITEATKRNAYRALAKPPAPVQCFTNGNVMTCY